MDYLIALSEFAAKLRYEDLPEDVKERARLIIRDTLAVAVSGSQEPTVRSAAAMLRRRGSNGNSSFILGAETGDAADAAFINALAACSHVLDEGHKFARGHVATYVLPSVLAVAEEQNVDGKEFLTAFIAGYEVTARLGMACLVRPTMHPTGTWGMVGAAAAVARLMGFDADGIRKSMNLAAPLTHATSWKAATEGASVRDLYSAYGGSGAIWAPRWVEGGFTSAENDVDNIFGNVSSERFDRDAAVAGLGSTWQILLNYFKVHACCRNFQSGIDVAVSLSQERKIAANDIVGVRAETFAAPVRDNANASPQNVLAAKESFAYSLALTLVNGKCDQSVFTPERVFTPEVKRVAEATEIVCDPELDAAFPTERPTRLTLTLANGEKISRIARQAYGDPEAPIPLAELKSKYHDNLDPWIGKENAERLEADIDGVDARTSIRGLMETIAASNAPVLKQLAGE